MERGVLEVIWWSHTGSGLSSPWVTVNQRWGDPVLGAVLGGVCRCLQVSAAALPFVLISCPALLSFSLGGMSVLGSSARAFEPQEQVSTANQRLAPCYRKVPAVKQSWEGQTRPG